MTKVSAFTAAAGFLEADEFGVNEAGTTKKLTGAQIRVGIGGLTNQSTTTQTPAAATLTYLTGSSISIPVGKLRIGSWFHWHLDYSKTAAGAAARTYDIRLGLGGATTDAAVVTHTTTVSTAVGDAGYTDIYATCRGPLSASGIFQCAFFSTHNLQTTGLLNLQTLYTQVTSGVIDVTVANLIIGISTTSAASEAISYAQVLVEARNL